MFLPEHRTGPRDHQSDGAHVEIGDAVARVARDGTVTPDRRREVGVVEVVSVEAPVPVSPEPASVDLKRADPHIPEPSMNWPASG